jgi:hypothetical protein
MVGVVVYLPRRRSEDADLVQALNRSGCPPLTGAGAFGIRS